ncbi:UNVERIFIED_CONTAM: hypothetical protein RMT77_009020 [Armadillidium vulgare]
MKPNYLDLKSEADLEFIGEGNEHVVLGLANTGNVIRFRKFPLDQMISREEVMLRVQEDLSFVNEIARPLAGSLLVDEAQIVSVDPLLLQKVMERIKPRRDVKRLTKVVNKLGIGVLTTNVATQFVQRNREAKNSFVNILNFSIPNGLVSVSSSPFYFSVEYPRIKTKDIETITLKNNVITTITKDTMTTLTTTSANTNTKSAHTYSITSESLLNPEIILETSTTTPSGVYSPESHISNLIYENIIDTLSDTSPQSTNILNQDLIPEEKQSKQSDISSQPSKLVTERKKICIELKPKQGFLESGPRHILLCRFCLKQYIKIQTRDELRKSSYCPKDFFSGEPTVMEKALQNLFSCPQNNLKLFCNGDRVSDIEQYRYLSELVVQILTNNIYAEKTPNPSKVKTNNSSPSNSSSCFPYSPNFTPTSSSSSPSPPSASGSSSEIAFKSISDDQRKKVDEYRNANTSHQAALILAKGSTLSPQSFLGRLLLLQLFGNNSEIHGAYLYRELQKRTTSRNLLHDSLITKFEFLKQKLQISMNKILSDVPTKWSNNFKDFSDESVTPVFEGKISDLADETIIQLLQQCLVAMSAKDASIMILIEGPYYRKAHCQKVSESSSPFWLEFPVGSSQWHRCQVSLVDMAQKHPDKLLQHEISLQNYENILLDLKAKGKEPSCCQNRKRKLN